MTPSGGSRMSGPKASKDTAGFHGIKGVSAHLPQGFRAVGTRVNMESIAGGFASLPLSRVDVIHTVRRGGDNEPVGLTREGYHRAAASRFDDDRARHIAHE